ncbi:g2166 [Coccomyxa elongata]
MYAQSRSLFSYDETQRKTQKQAARTSNSEPRAVCASVWVGNLNWNITEAHLRRAMAMFIGEPIGLHGPIQNAKMLCCYAMVDFATHAEASELLKHCAAPHNAQDPWAEVLRSIIGAPYLPAVEAGIRDPNINPHKCPRGSPPPATLDGYVSVKCGDNNEHVAWLKKETLEKPLQVVPYVSETRTPHQPRHGTAPVKTQRATSSPSPRDHFKFARDAMRHDPILGETGGKILW